MRTKGRPQSLRHPVIISLLLGASSVCLLVLLEVFRNKFQVLNKSSESSSNIKEDDKFEREQEFRWSGDIQDWTLVEEHQVAKEVKLIKPAEPQALEDPSGRCIWPEDDCRADSSDRIINQLLLSETCDDDDDDRFFKIALAGERTQDLGQEVFLRDKCRVNKCLISNDLKQADAIIWPNSDIPSDSLGPSFVRRPSQIWIAYLLESPPNTFDRRFKRRHRGQHEFNWTASYRSDSDIVTPYSKFVPYHLRSQVSSQVTRSIQTNRKQVDLNYERASERHKQLVAGKKGARVAWLVSNCHAHNKRLEFARELGRFIQVDIYGKCGNLTCAKTNQSECLAHLNLNYKFYLSFENSNNREYITEKLYRNAHGYNNPDYLLLPIVMGPSRQDYERLAPPGSFVHVDDFETVQDLASYLHELNNDPALYYSYFHWKKVGRFIDTKFLCRTCAMLHDSCRRNKIKSYTNIQEWWLES